jgi:hypothetical protein
MTSSPLGQSPQRVQFSARERQLPLSRNPFPAAESALEIQTRTDPSQRKSRDDFPPRNLRVEPGVFRLRSTSVPAAQTGASFAHSSMVPPSFATTQQPRVCHDLATSPLLESSLQPVSSIRQHALKVIIPISRRSREISRSHNLSNLPFPRNQIALFPFISTNIPIDTNRLISYIMSSEKTD